MDLISMLGDFYLVEKSAERTWEVRKTFHGNAVFFSLDRQKCINYIKENTNA